MTSPYTTALLNEPPTMTADVTHPAARAAMVSAMPAAPMTVAAPIIVQGAGSSRMANVMMGIVVIALAALASVAGYMAARQASPSPQEFSRYQGIAGYEGFQQGRLNGYRLGHDYAVAQQRDLNRIKAAIARQRVYNRGYAQGKRTGLDSWRNRPRYGGYGYSRPYRPYRSYGTSGYQVSSALASAQQYANATGSVVDVEIH